MNFGIENEYKIVEYLNKKRYKNLNKDWKANILKIFPNINDDDYIFAYKIRDKCKPDIVISVNNADRYVSVKVGYRVSPHRENMENFYAFLMSIGVNKYYIETLKYYHFGDGTINGFGKERFCVDDVKKMFKDRIKEFNVFINDDKYLYKIFDRILKKGNGFFDCYAEYLYLGNEISGKIVKMDELIEYLVKTKSMYLDSIHFGPFIYTPGYRGLSDFDPYNYDRYCVVLRWFTIIDDVEYLYGNITSYKADALKKENALKLDKD